MARNEADERRRGAWRQEKRRGKYKDHRSPKKHQKRRIGLVILHLGDYNSAWHPGKRDGRAKPPAQRKEQ